jgi:hypothetical protein
MVKPCAPLIHREDKGPEDEDTNNMRPPAGQSPSLLLDRDEDTADREEERVGPS